MRNSVQGLVQLAATGGIALDAPQTRMSVMRRIRANDCLWDHAAGMALKVAARSDVPDRLRLARNGRSLFSGRASAQTLKHARSKAPCRAVVLGPTNFNDVVVSVRAAAIPMSDLNFLARNGGFPGLASRLHQFGCQSAAVHM